MQVLVSIEKTSRVEGPVYRKVLEFKRKYHGGIAWRVRKHCAIVERHLNPGEEVLYAFPAQRNLSHKDIFNTCVLALTNKRILIGQKRLLYGYILLSITPDLFNDLEVYEGLIWGTITIDTVKELVNLSNIDKNALPDIETNITEFMMEEKKKYQLRND